MEEMEEMDEMKVKSTEVIQKMYNVIIKIRLEIPRML